MKRRDNIAAITSIFVTLMAVFGPLAFAAAPCDFDGDGQCDVTDIHALLDETSATFFWPLLSEDNAQCRQLRCEMIGELHPRHDIIPGHVKCSQSRWLLFISHRPAPCRVSAGSPAGQFHGNLADVP